MAEPKTTCQNRLLIIARPKQLQGFTGFKTEIQVRNVLNFLSWTVYIWKKFRLKRFSFAYVYAAKVNKNILYHILSIVFNRFVEGNAKPSIVLTW